MFFIWNWIPDDDRSGFYQLEKIAENWFDVETVITHEIIFQSIQRVRVRVSCLHGGRLSLWGWRKKVVIRGQNAEWGWGRKVLIWGQSAEWGWRKKLVISGQSSEWSWWRKLVIRVHTAEGYSMRKMPYVQMV